MCFDGNFINMMEKTPQWRGRTDELKYSDFSTQGGQEETVN